MTLALHTSSRLRPRRKRAMSLAIVDVVAGALAVSVSALAGGKGVASPGWTAIFLTVVLLNLMARGSYRTRLQTSMFDHVTEVLVATAIAASVVITSRVILEDEPFAAAETVRLWGFAAVYLFAGRLAVNIATHSSGRYGMPTLIVGAGRVGQSVAQRLLSRPEIGLRPIGFLDRQPRELGPDLPPVLGDSYDLAAIVHEHGVEHVLITFSTAPPPVLLRLLREARSLDVDVMLVPRLFEEVNRRSRVEHLGGVALLRMATVDPRGWQFEVKYALDRIVAGTALAVLSPLYLVLAALVRVSSPGPIIFRQSRVGRDGREFEILKFRSMRVGAVGQENHAAWAVSVLGGDQTSVTAEDRRTTIGVFMRRMSLDELPQLLNVARGDMSLVGPRPEIPQYVQMFGERVYRYGDRHRVKSGLTGWAQVSGLRGETSLEDRVEWDNWYVENWSPWLDLKILLLTPMAVLDGRGL